MKVYFPLNNLKEVNSFLERPSNDLDLYPGEGFHLGETPLGPSGEEKEEFPPLLMVILQFRAVWTQDSSIWLKVVQNKRE